MKKTLTVSLALLLVLTLALPAWAGRNHRPRPHQPQQHHRHHHKHHNRHANIHMHAVGAGLLGIGLVTGAAIAGAFHQPPVVVHHTPPPRPRPAPHRWQGRPHRPHKGGRQYELGAAQVTVHLLNVRQSPGRHQPIMMQVCQGTYLGVRATSDGWLCVTLGHGRVGWVMKRHTSWGRRNADG